MPPVVVDPKSLHEFATIEELESWMRKHHNSTSELWIKVHKKASGLPTVTTAEALDVMLCWGWIDGIRKSLDETSFLQRYSPRQKRSPWSLINTQHVARLIAAKRMQAPGQAEIDRTKADGRWDIAYSGAKDMKTPPDLMAAIDANPKARALYDNLTSQNRYALSFRLVNLKTEAARTRKIQNFVEMLARGETIYPNRPTAVLLKELKEHGRPLMHKKPSKAPAKKAGKTAGVKTAKVATKAAKKGAKKSAVPVVKKVAKKTVKTAAKKR